MFNYMYLITCRLFSEVVNVVVIMFHMAIFKFLDRNLPMMV